MGERCSRKKKREEKKYIFVHSSSRAFTLFRSIKMLNRLARPVMRASQRKHAFHHSDCTAWLKDPRVPGISYGVANVMQLCAVIAPFMSAYMYTSKMKDWAKVKAWHSQGRRRFEN